MKTTLCIGDSHVDQDDDLVRFDWCANLIEDRRPDTICQMGDWLSLDSLNTFDTLRILNREGRRLAREIEQGVEAREILDRRIRLINDKAKALHRARYNPTKVWLEGNHEYRIQRYIATKPELAGMLGTDRSLVGAEDNGWILVDYPGSYSADGVRYFHCPINPRTGKSLGGEYVAGRAAQSETETVVFGHTHRRLVQSTQSRGYRRDGINVGWFGGKIPAYLDQQSADKTDWWTGLVILTHVGYSHVDIETISMERLEAMYR